VAPAIRWQILILIDTISEPRALLISQICYPLMDSLLFWATSPAAYVKDNLPTSTHLSAQNLVMECFSKMCSHSNNIDLLLATPPWERMMKLFGILAEFLNSSNQVRLLAVPDT